jgi:putative membrane protein
MQERYESYDGRGRFPTALVAVIAVAFAVLIAVVLILLYFSSGYYYGSPYGYGWRGMMGGWMGFPMLFMFPIGIIILIIIGYVIYRGVWWGGGCCGGRYGYYRHYSSDEEKENAMEILRRRYARGEITKEQFEQMKRDIS